MRTPRPLDPARVRAVRAEDGPGDLGPARTRDAGQGHDLARVDGQVHVAEAAVGPRQAPHLKDRLAPFDVLLVEHFGQLAADHEVDDALDACLGHRHAACEPAVAKDDDAVGDLEDLLQPVRDVDDRHALVA